jgi:hypothetical protein
LQSGVVSLNWQAIRDKNAKTYDVQRSTDGINFTIINTVNANTVTDTSNYAYSDNQPASGINYYRIKRTGNDGSISYFNVVTINVTITAVSTVNNTNNDILVSPVPVQRGNNLTVITGRDGLITYKIVTLLGQPVTTGTFYTTTNISTNQLSPGVYLIVFTSGKTIISKKIMIE